MNKTKTNLETISHTQLAARVQSNIIKQRIQVGRY